MPELPEVETVCRGLARALEGRRLVRVVQRRADLRWPLPAGFSRRLQGNKVLQVRRRAKYILAEMDNGMVLLAHLGMSGRMCIQAGAATGDTPPGPHDHVVFTTDDGTVITFNDARRFGMMDLVERDALDRHKLLQGLGPEPLGNEFSGPVLSTALSGKRTPIKAALLDQRVVAGLGNIYVSEALFRAAISPLRSAHTVAGARAERLVPAIKAVLLEAIDAGGSTLRDYVQTSGELGYFQHRFAVYDREGENCSRGGSGHLIRRVVQSGRSTFYCPRCQR